MENLKISRRKMLVIFLPDIIIFSIIFLFIRQDIKYEKLLKEDSCITRAAYSYYSKEHIPGNGSLAISTGFQLEYMGEKYKVTTKHFFKPIPVGIPIIVRFPPKCPDCAEILWDSLVTQNGCRIKYKYIVDKGYIYETSKVEN